MFSLIRHFPAHRRLRMLLTFDDGLPSVLTARFLQCILLILDSCQIYYAVDESPQFQITKSLFSYQCLGYYVVPQYLTILLVATMSGPKHGESLYPNMSISGRREGPGIALEATVQSGKGIPIVRIKNPRLSRFRFVCRVPKARRVCSRSTALSTEIDIY